MVISEKKTPEDIVRAWPGCKEVNLMSKDSMVMLWTFTMELSNRITKIEEHINKYFMLSQQNNPEVCKNDDNQ